MTDKFLRKISKPKCDFGVAAAAQNKTMNHHVSLHRNRSIWAVITNMAFPTLNYVNDHHVFFHRNRSLWAVVTNLALLIFAEVLYYHMNRVFIQKSHKLDKTKLYLKTGATYRLQ